MALAKVVVFLPEKWAIQQGKPLCFFGKIHEQTIIEIPQGDYISATVESFLYRSIRSFMFWIEREEMMPADWKNPIKKVDAPKVPDKSLNPFHSKM